jgi:CO/xanthine dehydrogenase FAD-binding subunit
VDEALHVLASSDVQVLAGGTDFYPALGDRPLRKPVLDIWGIPELRGISRHSDYIRIGGLTTWTEIIRAPLSRCFDMLKGAAREVGSVQIQNRGTVAGNLCNASPAADGVPPLLALDARVELVSAGGTRQMPLSEFITGNRTTNRRRDELVSAVLIPHGMENAASVFQKLGARRYLVISITSVAAAVLWNEHREISAARVAVGSCSAVAQRLTKLENDLVGAGSNDLAGLIRPEHLAPLAPISDVRASADYRLDASLTIIRRALTLCGEQR